MQSGQSTGAKYASDANYSSKLLGIIKSNGLDKYDQMAVQQAQLPIGYMRGAAITAPAADVTVGKSFGKVLTPMAGVWAMPLDTQQMVLTCDYGDTKHHATPHKGIDLRAEIGTPIHATEDNGTVVKSGFDKGGGGNYVSVLYQRADGSNYEVEYLHLSKRDVEIGDTVQAGQVLGATGNTGRSTGPHLDIRIKENGEWIDPKDYLAEIAVRGGYDTTLCSKATGEELLAQRKEGLSLGDGSSPAADDQLLLAQQQQQQSDQQQNNDLWSYLQNSQNGYDNGQDFFTKMLSTLFMGALSMAMQLSSMENDNAVDMSASQSEQDVAQAEKTSIMRHRDTVDPAKAHQMASMSFDSEYPEEQQQQQRMGIS